MTRLAGGFADREDPGELLLERLLLLWVIVLISYTLIMRSGSGATGVFARSS